MQRTEIPDAIAIRTARQRIVAGDGQMFCQTGRAVELWEREPLRLLKRWDAKSVLWVSTGKTEGGGNVNQIHLP